MVYGYARCSTNETKQDIARQLRDLKLRGAVEIFSEYASGAKNNRVKLADVLERLQLGDTLIVTEVPRLTRSLHELCHLSELAQSKKIKLICGALVLDFTEGEPCQMSLTMFYVMGLFGQHERGVTVDRIKSGLENAKANGKAVGRPKKTIDDIPQAVHEYLPRYKRGEITATEFAKSVGVSRPALYKYLHLLGVNIKKSNRSPMRKQDVPHLAKKLYKKYKAGELTIAQFARELGCSRTTVYSYVKILGG